MNEEPWKVSDVNKELKQVDMKYYALIEQTTSGMSKISEAITDLVEKEKDIVKLKAAHQDTHAQLIFLRNLLKERSVLLRESVDNLTGLFILLGISNIDTELMKYIKIELQSLDEMIADMTTITAEAFSQRSA